MTDTHTPGPWEASPDAVPNGYVQVTIYGADDRRVATVFESEANVSLIAAAPAMIVALEAALTEWHSHPKNIERREPEYVPMTRAAIAIARGEQVGTEAR